MKVYRLHNCTSKHRTVRTFLGCAVRRAAWVIGTGEFAVFAWCSVPTITLHESIADAEASLAAVNSTGCGGCCRRRHEIIRICLEGQETR